MSTFWPEGIELRDTQSPREILETAQDDWRKNSDGALGLVFQDAKSESGHSIIIVHAKHVPSNRTVTLFSIVHRPNCPYPATIQPEDEKLPQFLKKTYLKSGSSSFADHLGHLGSAVPRKADLLRSLDLERMVENPWVSDTPSEFREKLAKAFNLGSIKSILLNLISSSTGNESVTSEISTEELEES
jgi:hypothetical protein